MQSITIQDDIKVFYVEAISFPEGIGLAFQKLFSFFKTADERKLFGISRPENGQIVYKAAAEEKESGDLSRHDLPFMVIEKGAYIGLMIENFRNDIDSIGIAFEKLTSAPNIDPNGFCIEWYLGENDVLCLVKLSH